MSWCKESPPDIRNPGMKSGDAALGFLHILGPGNGHPFGNGLAGLKPGTHFGGVHLATKLLGQAALVLCGGIGFRSHDLLAG